MRVVTAMSVPSMVATLDGHVGREVESIVALLKGGCKDGWIRQTLKWFWNQQRELVIGFVDAGGRRLAFL